jgi:hypothetical protein
MSKSQLSVLYPRSSNYNEVTTSRASKNTSEPFNDQTKNDRKAHGKCLFFMIWVTIECVFDDKSKNHTYHAKILQILTLWWYFFMTIQAEIFTLTAWMGIQIDKHESVQSIQYFLRVKANPWSLGLKFCYEAYSTQIFRVNVKTTKGEYIKKSSQT